ncbi:MAG: MgtC/SapB family protein [Rhodospirillaceae bacterium]
MEQAEIFGRLALAFGIGLMIGIERGWRTRDMAEGTRALGMRTFALSGLLGGVLGLVGQFTSDTVTAVSAAGFIALVIVIYFTNLKQDAGRGATTEVAAILTFILGMTAVRGDISVAAASAVVVAATLGFKEQMHKWVERIDKDELTAALTLLLISVVILPVLPDQSYGPGETINPYVLWWIVVVIAAISFAAHISIRMFGERAGAAGVAVLGGLVSSTATTIAFARFAKAHAASSRLAASGIALAGTVMFIRSLVLTGLLFKDALAPLWPPLVAAALTSAVVAAFLGLGQRKKNSDGSLSVGPTADIMTGVKFVAAFAAIAVATHYAREYFGTGGALATSALGGLVDVDATNATMARLGAAGSASAWDVAVAVMVAVGVNSLAKGVYAVAIAGRTFAPLAILAFAPPVVAGAAALFIERQI